MIKKENVDLRQYTTIRIGGICREMFFPETINELMEIIICYPDIRILGGGSNLLVNDEIEFDHILCLREMEKNKILIDNGYVYVSAGVRLQTLIKHINKNGFGGIEYLYSVPGLVGGAIFMNAGRGRGSNKQISDYLISVDVLENGEIRTYTKDQCDFTYRHSIFQEKKCIILSAKFCFEPIDFNEGVRRQKERLEICRKFQDNEYPNAGTTFCYANPRIMNWVRRLSSKKSDSGIHFSVKCNNWLQNRGNGRFCDAVKCIRRVEMLHRFFKKEYKIEYKIWEG